MEDAYSRASRELDLTAQQAELLCAAMSPIPIGELAKVLRCDGSNASRLVDRAAKRGLLERVVDDEDGRVALAQLTAEGSRVARRFITSFESELAPLLAQWSEQRQVTAIEVMNDVADSLDAARPTDGRRRPAPRSRTTG